MSTAIAIVAFDYQRLLSLHREGAREREEGREGEKDKESEREGYRKREREKERGRKELTCVPWQKGGERERSRDR